MPIISNKQDFYNFFFEAERKRADGGLKDAVAIYLDLLNYRLKQVSQAADFTNYDAIIIERLADLSLLFGITEASLNLLTGLQQLYQEVNNTYLYVYTITRIANVRLEMGELKNTFELLKELSPFIGDINNIEMDIKGLPRWERSCRFEKLAQEERAVIFTRLYYMMGALLSKLGQYNDSINCLDRGLWWMERSGEDAAKAVLIPLELERVTALLEKGEVLKAEENLQSIKINNDNKITSGNYTGWLEINARIQFLKGNFGESLAYLSQVMEICSEYQLTRGGLMAIINLARIKILLNQLDEAESLLDDAASISKELGYDIIGRRITQLKYLAFKRGSTFLSPFNLSPSAPEKNRGRLPGELEDYTFEELLYLPQATNFLNFFDDRSLEFQILLANGKFNEAMLFLDNIKQIFAGTDSLLIQRRIEILDFLIKYYQKELDQYQFDFKAILDFLEKESLKPELWQFQRILSWTEFLSPEERERLVKANDRLLEEMTHSLPPENQAVFLLNKWTEDEEFLAAEIDELVYIKLNESRFKLFRIFSRLKIMSRLNKLLHHIDRYKCVLANRTINNQVVKEHTKRITSWFHRILFHPRDRVTLSLLVLPDRLLVAYTGFFKFNFKISYISRIQIRELIKELYQGIVTQGISRDISWTKKENPGENIPTISQTISSILHIPEILTGLRKSVNKITFIPDDSLNGFPFAALQYHNDFLVKKYAINIGYESKYQRYKENNVDRKTFLMVPISKGSAVLPPLPGSKKEVDELEKLFAGKPLKIKVLADEEANKKTILAELGSADFFHIACHGKFEYERPDSTGLHLLNREVLSLRDILNHDIFSGIEHVTLSSCWAADHFILPGRWVISLPETLWRSGVKSIMGCLWQVDDNIAIAFMKEFYKNIQQYPRDIALQKTQKAALENDLPGCGETESPFLWSGFNLYGDYKQLKFY